jgi:DNA-binding transcriptional LysR family regulator
VTALGLRYHERVSTECCEQSFGGWVWLVSPREVVLDMLAAVSGFHARVACRSSDYRFMSALVGAGVGVALVPGLALTGRPDVRDLPITPQPIRRRTRPG